MDMSSLFPVEGGMGNIVNISPAAHISFKAGILTRDPATNLVTADPRKGIFQIATSADDGLTRLQWRPKESSTFDPDYIIFPADAEMKQVTSCPASARVYVVKWREGDTRLFFWMQGKNPSADAHLVTSVNNILLRGPDAQQTSTDAEPPQTEQLATGNTPSLTETDTVLQPQSTQPEPSPTSAAPVTTPARGQITLEQMRQALESRSQASANPTSVLAIAQREMVATTPTVGDLLNIDNLRTTLADSHMQEAIADLFQHLPEQDRSLDAIEQVLRSPPLRTQAAALSQALQSEQVTELLRSFELPVPETQGGYGLRTFLDALLKLEKEAKERKG